MAPLRMNMQLGNQIRGYPGPGWIKPWYARHAVNSHIGIEVGNNRIRLSKKQCNMNVVHHSLNLV